MDISDASNRLGYYVRVTLKGKSQDLGGFLYTVDPSSGNVILLDCDMTPPNARVIMQHAIANVEVDSERCLGMKTMDAILQRTSFVCDDPAWLKTRRDAFIKYLEKHRVPFRQDENDPVIHVLGRARVEPPYVVTSVFCDNQIIGKRVQELVIKLG